MKISQPDGLPVNPGSEQITVSTRVTVEIPQPKTSTTQSPIFRPYYPQTKSIYLPVVSISVPDNGMVAVPVTVQSDATNVQIT
ncbi:thioester-containing protein, partial [Elysia marginata]